MPFAIALQRPGCRGELGARAVEDHAPFLGIVLRVEVGDLAGAFPLERLVHEERGVAAVVDDQRRALAVGPHQRLLGAPPVLLERLALPREDGRALGLLRRAVRPDDDCCGGVVLGREDVARHPADVGSEIDERLDQHRGLDRHVQAAHDAGAGERLLAGVLLAQGHQARHLAFGEADLLAAPFGQGEIGDLEGEAFGAGAHGSSSALDAMPRGTWHWIRSSRWSGIKALEGDAVNHGSPPRPRRAARRSCSAPSRPACTGRP